MPFASINGIRLYYEEHGSGYPVVFTHGYAGTTVSWKPQVPALSQKYRFIIYDMRGHGQTEAPRDPSLYSRSIAVEDLYQLLRYLGVREAVVGGLSLGGVISMEFALARPEMVKSLILMDTGPGFRNPQRLADWNTECEERARLLETGGMEAFMRSPYAVDDYYTPPEVMRRLNPIGLAHVARRVMANIPMLPLDKITAPTLILCGTRDKPFIAASYYMAQHIKGSFLSFIPKAGHGSNIDQPDLFNLLVLKWLEDLGL
ncbi:MAG: alpha/beta hydrolase [Dehalococcoidia bacterium]|nr:alpha/beta hydrolase [Dehalococcoidia bacterium]MDW8119430.1 alpha/beta hydrolase [Chloroflexota bacterium]